MVEVESVLKLLLLELEEDELLMTESLLIDRFSQQKLLKNTQKSDIDFRDSFTLDI